MRARALVCLLLMLAAPSVAAAQAIPGRIPPVVFDLRGFYSGLGQDPVTALQLGVLPTDLPTRGLGAVAGIHVIAFRRGKLAFGLGGEALLARGSRTPPVPEDPDPDAPIKPTVRQRLSGLSGQLSLNFGTANGWSYLTAGIGPMRFGTYLGDVAPAEPSLSHSTLNMGGGARWFAKAHVAFTFDVRYYLTRPEVQTDTYPGRQRNRLMVLSAGLSIK